MIILEGPDGVGKSTAATFLQHELVKNTVTDFPIYRIGPSPGYDQIVQYCDICVGRVDEFCIQDRVTQISEYVYSRIFPRATQTTAYFVDQFDRLIDENPIIIYCRISDLSKVQHTAEDYEKSEAGTIQQGLITRNMELIRSGYDDLLWTSRFERNTITFDYTKSDLVTLTNKIAKLIRSRGC